jgi:hypothetical protein
MTTFVMITYLMVPAMMIFFLADVGVKNRFDQGVKKEQE